MVAGLHIFPVDRQARFRFLREQTDGIRKCGDVLKLSGSKSDSLKGTSLRVKQTQNSFPFGSCLMRTNIDNEDFTKFFVDNFDWAVFGNELKRNKESSTTKMLMNSSISSQAMASESGATASSGRLRVKDMSSLGFFFLSPFYNAQKLDR